MDFVDPGGVVDGFGVGVGIGDRLFSLSPGEVRELEESDTKQSEAAVRLLEDKDRLLSTVLITNNLVNIGAILAANALIDGLVVFGQATVLEFIVKVIVVTFLLLLFGEIMPKIFAAYNTLSFTRRMAVPLLSLQRLFRPLSTLLIRAGGALPMRWPGSRPTCR